ncbi:MAG TPA: hypothetical protein VLM05_05465 [Mycobacteriales bacterium]|nr:hypothetical protein [Mycobacteriales bacterium]
MLTDLRTSERLRDEAYAGDEDAWGELVERHTGLLWAIARAHGLSRAAAEDVVRTVWLRVLESGGAGPVLPGLIAAARRESARFGPADAGHPLWPVIEELERVSGAAL